jgi:hypothetical protein
MHSVLPHRSFPLIHRHFAKQTPHPTTLTPTLPEKQLKVACAQTPHGC